MPINVAALRAAFDQIEAYQRDLKLPRMITLPEPYRAILLQFRATAISSGQHLFGIEVRYSEWMPENRMFLSYADGSSAIHKIDAEKP